MISGSYDVNPRWMAARSTHARAASSVWNVSTVDDCCSVSVPTMANACHRPSNICLINAWKCAPSPAVSERCQVLAIESTSSEWTSSADPPCAGGACQSKHIFKLKYHAGARRIGLPLHVADAKLFVASTQIPSVKGNPTVHRSHDIVRVALRFRSTSDLSRRSLF